MAVAVGVAVGVAGRVRRRRRGGAQDAARPLAEGLPVRVDWRAGALLLRRAGARGHRRGRLARRRAGAAGRCGQHGARHCAALALQEEAYRGGGLSAARAAGGTPAATGAAPSRRCAQPPAMHPARACPPAHPTPAALLPPTPPPPPAPPPPPRTFHALLLSASSTASASALSRRSRSSTVSRTKGCSSSLGQPRRASGRLLSRPCRKDLRRGCGGVEVWGTGEGGAGECRRLGARLLFRAAAAGGSGWQAACWHAGRQQQPEQAGLPAAHLKSGLMFEGNLTGSLTISWMRV